MPKQITIDLPDSTGNICKVKVRDWDIIAYKVPKANLNDFDQLNENPGLYFLLSPPTAGSNSKPCVYVGIAELRPVKTRINGRHNFKLDNWNWTEAIIFVREAFRKAISEIRYLEHEFCRLIYDAEKYFPVNRQKPNRAFTQDNPNFVENVKMIMNILGYHMFSDSSSESISTSNKNSTPSKKKNNIYHLSIATFKAEGYPNPTPSNKKQFTVLEGSTCRPDARPSCPRHIINKREELIKSNKIKNWVFTENVNFETSSLAGGCIVGGHISGPKSWLDSNDNPLKE